MIEKVNPSHPDKVADRIAGAIVDLAYRTEHDPKIAVEVLIGHGRCHVIIETTAVLDEDAITDAINRIAGDVTADIQIVPQDTHLSENQAEGLRCGDYRVSEVQDKVSEPYVLATDKIVTISAGAEVKIEMHNELRDTPKTGDDRNPTLWYALTGAGFIGAATCTLLAVKKKKKGGRK